MVEYIIGYIFLGCTLGVIGMILADTDSRRKKDKFMSNLSEREARCKDAIITISEFCRKNRERIPCRCCMWGDNDGNCTLKINDKTPDTWNFSMTNKASL